MSKEKEIKYCRKCGVPNKKDSVFCENCGCRFPEKLKKETNTADWPKILKNYGIKEKDFIVKRKTLLNKFRKEPSSYDIIWGLFNELLLKIMRTGNLYSLKSVYKDMALFLEEEGKDNSHILKIIDELDLKLKNIGQYAHEKRGYSSLEEKWDTWLNRNMKGIELEKEGEIDKAIKLYEQNIAENCDGSHPYMRLAILYRKRKDYDNEIRVLEKAILVWGGNGQELDKVRKRLEKAIKLKEK